MPICQYYLWLVKLNIVCELLVVRREVEIDIGNTLIDNIDHQIID